MTRRPPLEGVRVLDLTRFVSGPYCTMLLADQGAEVVKVEPLGGEATRALGPMLPEDETISTYFLRFNRTKKSVCVDLRSDAGREVLWALIRHADVLVENFRPGVLESMGLTWAALEAANPRLIYATITGFGHESSPMRARGAFTPIVEALAGALIHRTVGETPIIAGYPVGDLFPAALAAAAIGVALYRRERDGLGARVDMAMFDAMVSMNERSLGVSAMTHRNSMPGLPRDIGSAPSGVFRAKDGFVSMAVVGEKLWEQLCEAMGRIDWASRGDLSSGPARAERIDTVIRPGIEEWLAEKGRDEGVRLLTAAGIPAVAVAMPLDVLESEQARARDMIVRFPAFGRTATVTGDPIHFGGEPRRPAGAAAEVGAHTVDVLREWAGMSSERVSELIAACVVVQTSGSRHSETHRPVFDPGP